MIKNKYILSTLQQLQRNDIKSALFGGYLRDTIIGVEPKDVDILTNLKNDELILTFPQLQLRETINGLSIFYFQNHRTFFEIIPTTQDIEEQVSKSDLTINSLYFDGNVLKDTTTALQDISDKKLRFHNEENYRKNIQDSPHNWLKPFRLSAKLNFTIESQLLSTLESSKKLFPLIPTSIKIEEAYKILSTKNPINAIENLSKIGFFSNSIANHDHSFEIPHNFRNHHHITLCILAILLNKPIILDFIHQFEIPKFITEKFLNLYELYIHNSLPTDYRELNELLLIKRLLSS